jgi:hypothetical protein
MPQGLSSPDRSISYERIEDDTAYSTIAQDLAVFNNDRAASEFPTKALVADALAVMANLERVVPATRTPEQQDALQRIAVFHAQVGATLMTLGVEVPSRG